MALSNMSLTLAPTGSTGTGTFTPALGLEHANKIAVEVDAAAGGTSATFTIQGTMDGVAWFDLEYLDLDSATAVSKAALTLNPASQLVKYIDGLNYRFFTGIRINVSANTGITFGAKAYKV